MTLVHAGLQEMAISWCDFFHGISSCPLLSVIDSNSSPCPQAPLPLCGIINSCYIWADWPHKVLFAAIKWSRAWDRGRTLSMPPSMLWHGSPESTPTLLELFLLSTRRELTEEPATDGRFSTLWGPLACKMWRSSQWNLEMVASTIYQFRLMAFVDIEEIKEEY